MLVQISKTSSALNLGVDDEAADILTKRSGRCKVKFTGTHLLLCDSQLGYKLIRSGDKLRASFRDPKLMQEYPKHGLITFKKEDVVCGDGVISIKLPHDLPPHTDLIRKNIPTVVIQQLKLDLEKSETANLVLTIGKTTMSYNVPAEELLQIAVKLAHSGYALNK